MSKKTENNKNPDSNLVQRIEELRARIQPLASTQKAEKTQPKDTQISFIQKRELDLIRPELNVSKFADFIFISPRSKKITQVRKKQWGEEENKTSITIIPAKYELIGKEGEGAIETRAPSVTTAQYFYALVKIWENQGKPSNGEMVFSGADLFRILNIKAGKSSYQRLQRELHVLKSCSIQWSFSFTEKENGEDFVYRGTKSISLLSDFYYMDKHMRRTPQDIFAPHISAIFGGSILKNMNAGLTKPLVLDEYLKIRSYDGARLYSMLDIFLSKKRHWKRNSAGLLEDLEIEGDAYNSKRTRKQKLEGLVRHLQGRQLSLGKLKLKIEQGKTDWVLRAERIPTKEPRRIPDGGNPPELIDELVHEMGRWIGLPTAPDKEGTPPISRMYAKAYPEEMVRYALSRYRSDVHHDSAVRNKPALFTVYLHEEAHKRDLKWIGNCAGVHCKYRLGLFS